MGGQPAAVHEGGPSMTAPQHRDWGELLGPERDPEDTETGLRRALGQDIPRRRRDPVIESTDPALVAEVKRAAGLA